MVNLLSFQNSISSSSTATSSVTRTWELVADTVEAYENGELAKLLGIDTEEENEL